jgi:hypothetical protein
LTVTDKNYVEFVPIEENENRSEHRMRGYKAINLDKIKHI